MSTSTNQIIEVNLGGKWTYVPLASVVNDGTNTLEQCGSVRDLFSYKWHNAEKYISFGVPDDISKEAREAMVYRDQDFIESDACWISWRQYEALAETLREKMIGDIDSLVRVKVGNRTGTTLSKIEDKVNAIEAKLNGKEYKQTSYECDGDFENEDYVREDLEDHMWAWCNAERNMAEIEAYVYRFLDQDYCREDFPGMDTGVRIIMFTS